MKKIKVFVFLLQISSFGAEASLDEGGMMVIGRGRGQGAIGEGTSSFCVDQETIRASTVMAKKLAAVSAAGQCRSGKADRIGEFLLNEHCSVWNSVFPGTLAQAAYVCRYQ